MDTGTYVKVANTNLELFKLGFGTVSAGRSIPDKELGSCLDFYRERGGNVIDSARVYANGKSEEALGRYFKKSNNKNNFILITKGGHPPLTDLHHSRLSFAEVESDLDNSLKALSVDCIDLYFLHRDDEKQEIGNLIEMLEVFVSKGKIKYYGCSNFSPKRMKQADIYAKDHNYRGFVANEMFYNIASDRMKPFPDDTLSVMDKEMYAYHDENRCNLAMPYFSVCSGFFHQLIKDPNDPELRKSPYYTVGNLAVFKNIQRLMASYNASLSQVILGFYKTCGFSTIPLFGALNIPMLEDALGYLDINFEIEDFMLE